ncbi:MAG TPA: helix-turn-helix domain-containing protein [Candidatus Acidoferrales bacterium]|nr:helix-turn-helix domain-containing protein [Candidatus Acidoferrales bacterium]
MASRATIRTAKLAPSDWIRAALVRLSAQGIDAVRVEALARDLGVSKGSFYWHFRDRDDLLEKMLGRWESAELAWLGPEAGDSAAARWARLIEKTAEPARMRVEVALRAWARSDERVAGRMAAIERRKAGSIADVLREVGFARAAAESWSEVVLLVCLGWPDKATRDPRFELASRGLGEILSQVILAASARTAASSG